LPGKVYSLGVLDMGNGPRSSVAGPFEDELARLGFVEGVNLRTHVRFAGGDPARLAALAAELIALRPDIILSASGTRGALAVKRQTTSVPIVFTMSNDPVGAGLVTSLAHPGGNATGNVAFGDALDLKRLQILAQVMGARATLAVLDGELAEHRRVALRHQVAASGANPVARLRLIEVARAADLELAFEGMVRDGVRGVAVNFSPMTAVNDERIARLIVKHRLAAIGDGQAYVDGGVLLSYSTDQVEISSRAARYVAKILQGSKPGDLPVEHASKFVLIVNNKTAKALGIKIPPWILASAEKVID
jgi:putative tryptophan/tyrosine transport system substrate-binding protein